MAQTEAKPKSRSAGSKSKSSSRSSGSKTKAKSGTKSKSGSSNSKSQTSSPKATSSSNGASSSNGSRGTIAEAASKAKVPLMAGGAALIGAASGVAYGASHSGNKVMGIKMPGSKRVKFKTRDLRKAAKDVGHFGDQVGHLTKELRKAREDSDGSIGAPVEVLVRGLMRKR